MATPSTHKGQQIETTFRHSGDLGDVIAALPAIRQLGGGRIICCEPETKLEGLTARESLKGKRFEMLKPLLLAQPYITGVEWSDEIKHATHTTWEFRAKLLPKESLAHAQARHLGLDFLETNPWLTVPNIQPNLRVVIARSLRYHNPLWDPIWPEIGKRYEKKLLFVGLPAEHDAMERIMDRTILHAHTPNLLEAAKVIGSSQLCISNQSCPAWIALGLGHRYIQETDDNRPNSIIPYAKAFYAGNESETNYLLSRLRGEA